MSAENCILYRKIDADWWILPHAFTYDDWDEKPDDDLKAVAWKLPEHMDVFATLSSLAEAIDYTEHGILYSCPYKSDAPPEVPGGHKWLLSSDFERPEYVKAREEHKANFRGEVFVNHEMCACGCSTTTGATEWCKKKNAEIARKAFVFSSKEKLEAACKEAREGPSACIAAYDGGPIAEFSSSGQEIDLTGPTDVKVTIGEEVFDGKIEWGAKIEPSLDEDEPGSIKAAFRIVDELREALEACLHVIEKGIEVRMQDQWPALKGLLEDAKEKAANALL